MAGISSSELLKYVTLGASGALLPSSSTSRFENTVRKKCIKCINLLHYKHSHFYYFTNLLI